MLHDAIIVLGYNNDPGNSIFQARVKKAAALYHDGAAPQIILSGCCSMKLDIRPRLTEAQAMYDYALELDVPGQVMLLEEEAVDTMGNFYYSKTRYLLDCAWYNVAFVSTPGHVGRSQWLAERILGPDFDITGYESELPDDWNEEGIRMSQAYNRNLLAHAKKEMRHIEPGDHEAVRPLLGKAPAATRQDSNNG